MNSAMNHTYSLLCRHSDGKNSYDYDMPCELIKIMPDGERAKVLVMGRKKWQNKSVTQKYFRYVSLQRLINRR